jgi:glyoxylase-like metal-dependent hydrolase (beta-lactamase superfamily II)
MKIIEGIYLVGSGQFGLSSDLDCHIYLVHDGDEAVLIDAGAGKFEDDVNYILANIENDGFSLKTVKRFLLTHAHADHSGGGKALKEKLECEAVSGIETKGFVEKGLEHELGLDFAKRSGFYGDDYKFKPFKIDTVIKDGDTITVGNTTIKAILTPGHSTDSMSYLLEKAGNRVLFTGDVVNHGGRMVLLNCEGFDLKMYRENIKKLSNLNIDMLYPGHGVFTLKNGQSHIDILINAFDKLLIYNQLVF